MKIGFVGCGNMATAIIGGILEKGILKKEDIKASTKTENSAKKVQETLGIECTIDNKKAVQDADVIFLAVKPQFCEEVIQEIKSEIKSEQVIISTAATVFRFRSRSARRNRGWPAPRYCGSTRTNGPDPSTARPPRP